MVPTVIVTGASRGIGLAICRHLLSNSASNVFAVARDPEPLQQLQATNPGRVRYLCGDLADASFGAAVAAQCLEAFGAIDAVAVNHAVVEPVGLAGEIAAADWVRTFGVNFFGSVALVNASLSALRESQGRVIFTQSHSIHRYYRGWGLYGASKAALNHYAGTLALEEPLISVVGIVPGMVDTDMSTRVRELYGPAMSQEDHESLIRLYETGQMVKPEQPGAVIAELALQVPLSVRGRFLDWDDGVLHTSPEQL